MIGVYAPEIAGMLGKIAKENGHYSLGKKLSKFSREFGSEPSRFFEYPIPTIYRDSFKKLPNGDIESIENGCKTVTKPNGTKIKYVDDVYNNLDQIHKKFPDGSSSIENTSHGLTTRIIKQKANGEKIDLNFRTGEAKIYGPDGKVLKQRVRNADNKTWSTVV